MRLRLIVLWILLALLPLRGWAFSGMQVDMAAGEVAMASQVVVSGTPHHASAPCHEAAASDAADDSDMAGTSHAGCSLCDVCHSVALFNAAPPLGAAQVAVTRAHPLTRTDTGRSLVGGLDRPPRISRA